MKKLIHLLTPLSVAALLSGCLYNPYPLIEQALKKEKAQDWSWVPKNFEADLTSGNIAFRYLDSKETSCSFNIPCIQIEVLSKDGCETLYAQASLLDANGANVGYANDLTKSVRANGKAILTFKNTTQNAVNIERPKFNCY
jgi:hypothetical protein